jgi:TfoX/Sxy family transcriptional regulator of competence genes
VEEARRGERKSVRSPTLPTSKKKTPTNDHVALYDRLIATHPEIERKGDANPYTSLNGNMFTLLHQGRLAIRLSEEEREKFLKKYKTNLFEAYGTIMKEYVAVPDFLLEDTKALSKYLDLSYAYAKTLKPKPTTKKKR